MPSESVGIDRVHGIQPETEKDERVVEELEKEIAFTLIRRFQADGLGQSDYHRRNFGIAHTIVFASSRAGFICNVWHRVTCECLSYTDCLTQYSIKNVGSLSSFFDSRDTCQIAI